MFWTATFPRDVQRPAAAAAAAAFLDPILASWSHPEGGTPLFSCFSAMGFLLVAIALVATASGPAFCRRELVS